MQSSPLINASPYNSINMCQRYYYRSPHPSASTEFRVPRLTKKVPCHQYILDACQYWDALGYLWFVESIIINYFCTFNLPNYGKIFLYRAFGIIQVPEQVTMH